MIQQLYFNLFQKEDEIQNQKRSDTDKIANKYKNRNKIIHEFCKNNRDCTSIKTLELKETNQILIWNGKGGWIVKINDTKGFENKLEMLKKDLQSDFNAEKMMNKMRYASAKSRKELENSKTKIIQISLF